MVYLLRHKATGGVYVGSTKDFKRRMREHARHPPKRLARALDPAKPFWEQVEAQQLQGGLASARDAEAMERRVCLHHKATGPGGFNYVVGRPAFNARFHAMRGRQTLQSKQGG